MTSRDFTDDFVRQVTEDLRARYDLDADAVQQLGERLAGVDGERRRENRRFAERFTDEHRATFDRLAT